MLCDWKYDVCMGADSETEILAKGAESEIMNSIKASAASRPQTLVTDADYASSGADTHCL